MKTAERTREMEKLAQENNWKFSSSVDVSAVLALNLFELQAGEKRLAARLENLLEGESFKVLDVYWKNEFRVSDAFGPLAHKNTSSQNVRQQTLVFYELAKKQLPKFHLYPKKSESWLNRLFSQTNSSLPPELAKNWILEGAADSFFSQEIVDFYKSDENFWTFGAANYIFIYQPNLLLEIKDIPFWLTKIQKLAGILEK